MLNIGVELATRGRVLTASSHRLHPLPVSSHECGATGYTFYSCRHRFWSRGLFFYLQIQIAPLSEAIGARACFWCIVEMGKSTEVAEFEAKLP